MALSQPCTRPWSRHGSRSGLPSVRRFALAGEGRWQEIDGLAAVQSGPGLLIKLLYAYFPDEILPITLRRQTRPLLELLEQSDVAGDQKLGRLANRALFAALRSLGPGANWTTKEWERFLFRKFSPLRDA